MTAYRPASPLPPRVLLGGGLALAAILALVLGSLAMVLGRAGETDGLGPADWRALRFTVVQATLSALLSVGLALPVARALARRRFPGRGLLTTLLGAPFLLPVIVAVIGLLTVWGRSGWVSDVSLSLGGPRMDIYGMPGVLLAHVFFNLPLAARLILQGYAQVPPERWRVAAQLGLEGWSLFRAVEWPAIRGVLPGAAALVFLVCATSFAVALTLGGGPRATTLELAIYEAANYSFDLGRAARLAALQLAVCAGAALLAFALAAPVTAAPGTLVLVERWDGRGAGAKSFDMLVLVAVSVFLALPVAALAVRGSVGVLELPVGVLWAAVRSLCVAVLSTVLCLGLSLGLAALIAGLKARGWGARAVDLAALSPLAASPFVLGIAAILALRGLADPFALALPLTALVNALSAAPFAVRALEPAIRQADAEHGRLADSLGLQGVGRLRAVYGGRLKAPLGFAGGLAAALSLGDLGVIALFARADAPTLPLAMHQLASARQLDAAHGAALVLVVLTFCAFYAFDRWGRS